jgi:hypothetical protein
MLSDKTYLNRVTQLTCLLMVALSVAIIYSPITKLSFANPDDHWMLLKNEFAHPAAYSLDYFSQIFHRVNNVQYSPLNTFYYSLILKINGYDPYYFHLANVFIHFLNAILVFLLAREILRSFRVEGAAYISLLTCLLWGINSINIEPVAWISGSKILLCTCLTLCSFLFFIKGFLKDSLPYLTLSFLTFFISFFFKEQAIITPVLLCLFVFFYNLSTTGKVRLKGVYLSFLLLFFLCAVLFGLHTIKVNYDQNLIVPPIHNYPWYQKVILVCYCFSFYFYSVVFPFDLHYNYLFPFEPYASIPPIVYLCLPAIILVVVFYYRIYKKSAGFYLYLFLFSLFLCEIFLQLQIIPMTRPAIMADRFMYFPSIPLLITFSKILFDFFRNKKSMSDYIAFSLFAFYAVSMIIRSNNIVHYWINFNLIK